MSTPLPSSSLSPLVATNTMVPPLAVPAYLLPSASCGSPLAIYRSCRFTLSKGLVKEVTSVIVVAMLAVLAVLAVLVVLVLVGLLFKYLKKWRRPPVSASPSIPCKFTFDELLLFTGDFSRENLLGEGGFGPVYRGARTTGEAIAVKLLKKGSEQGEPEFWTELKILSKVHHKHVVSLIGYCTTGPMLVYELVPNKTLEFHLHGEGQLTLIWPDRLKIAVGSAKGLAYLHDGCHPEIIHRDIKAANILIDNEFEAKIADFGLAKYASDANSHGPRKGTFWYIAPEYAIEGELTKNSDTYSFGVVLLELITGHKPADYGGLVNWAGPQLTQALKDGDFGLFVDPKLQNNYCKKEMARMVACAAACVRRSPGDRPTMSKIVRVLIGDLHHSSLNAEITNHRESWDSGTSHYREPSSEHGLYPYGLSIIGPSRQTNGDLELGRMEGDGQGFSGDS